MAEKKGAKKTTTRKKGAKTPPKQRGTAANIGIDVKPPKQECDDQFCPFHGTLSVRGQILEGIVVTDRMQNTAVVRREYMREIPKYERLEKKSGKYIVHSPPCLEAKAGDQVIAPRQGIPADRAGKGGGTNKTLDTGYPLTIMIYEFRETTDPRSWGLNQREYGHTIRKNGYNQGCGGG